MSRSFLHNPKRKDFLREIWRSKSRFLSILFIVSLGTAFFSGIKSAGPDMELSADRFYRDSLLMDIRIVGTMGLTGEDVEAVEAIEGVAMARGGCTADVLCRGDGREQVMRIYSLSDPINQFTVIRGRLPKAAGECLIDAGNPKAAQYHIGDVVNVYSGTGDPIDGILVTDSFTVVGEGISSRFLSADRGASGIGDGSLDGFMAVAQDSFRLNFYTDIYVLAKESGYGAYSEEYDSKMKELAERIEKNLADERCDIRLRQIEKEAVKRASAGRGERNVIKQLKWAVMDRKSIPTYVEYGGDARRIAAIGRVFPAIFFLVAALVSLTAMTRMVEEERLQIGTLKALGYGRWKIASKYIFYALSATLAGSALGVLVGEKALPYVILTSYQILYQNLPVMEIPYRLEYALTAAVLAVLCTVTAAAFSCYRELLCAPAELMRPESPREGKKVVVERLEFLWKRLNFMQKAAVRNLFRYKKRCFMTIFGIGGCMALLLVGFGIRDSVSVLGERQFNDIWTYDALLSLSKEGLKEESGGRLTEYLNGERVGMRLRARQSLLSAGAGKTTKEASLFVPEEPEKIPDFVQLKNRMTGERYELDDRSVIVTEKLAALLRLSEGDTIWLEEKEGGRFPAVVGGIAENYLQHSIYMTPGLYRQLSGREPEYNAMFLNMEGLDGVEEASLSAGLLSTGEVAAVTMLSSMKRQINDMLDRLNVVIWVLILSAGLLAFVVLYNLNEINITERRRELATIKVLGFYDKELASYVFRENAALTVTGCALGVFLGYFLHRYVMTTVEVDMMMFGRQIRPVSYGYGAALTCLFSLMVSAVMYRKLKRINMVESLKSVE